MVFSEIANDMQRYLPLIRMLILVILFWILFNLIVAVVKKRLLKRAKTKKQKSNIQIFSRLLKYVIFIIIVLLAIFSYAGSWTALGLSVGLLSAALGWALQRPITGVAGWVMVVTKRPFDIGDRIIIGNVRGDVEDISLTHVYIKEIGGIVAGEENSGRIVMIPNAKLFEQDIINYTLQDDYILDQVAVTVTYEGNLDKAIEIALKSAGKLLKDVIKKTKKKPYVRTYFDPNGVQVRVRYFAPAKELQKYSSNITKEIYDRIMESRDVEIAYPHTELLYRKKPKR